MQITKSDIGKNVTLKWDKVGYIDALLVDADGFTKSGKVFIPDVGVENITAKQVVSINNY